MEELSESNSNNKTLIADVSMKRKGVSPPPSILYAIAFNKSPEMIAEDVFRKRMFTKLRPNTTIPNNLCLWCNGELIAYTLSSYTRMLEKKYLFSEDELTDKKEKHKKEIVNDIHGESAESNVKRNNKYEGNKDEPYERFMTFFQNHVELFPKEDDKDADPQQVRRECFTIEKAANHVKDFFIDEKQFLDLDNDRFDKFFHDQGDEVKKKIKLYRECFMLDMYFEEWQTAEQLQNLLDSLKLPDLDIFYKKVVVTVKHPVIDSVKEIVKEENFVKEFVKEEDFEGSNENTQYSRYVDICNILTSLEQALTLVLALDV